MMYLKPYISVLISALVLAIASPAAAQSSLGVAVARERAKYPASTLAPEQLAQLLNAVAWDARADGWGLLAKPSGNHCPRADVFVACDILMHQPTGRIFDVLADAEGSARPTWGEAGGSPAEASRWIAPIAPAGGSEPPPPPPPPPPTCDLTPALERLAALEARLDAIAQNASNQAEAVVTASQEIRDLLRELKARPWPTYQGRLWGQSFTLTPR